MPEAADKKKLQEALEQLKSLGPKLHCPHCGKPLESIGCNPNVLCGSIFYFKCATCQSFYRENQSGIVGRPCNLEEIQVADEKELKAFMRIDAVAP